MFNHSISRVRFILILIFVCVVCVACVNAAIGIPNLVVHTNTPTIERGSTGTLTVTVQEISGEDSATGVVVTPTIALSSGCSIIPEVRTTSKIRPHTTSSFSFTISAPSDTEIGTYSGEVRVKYFETGMMDIGVYGPYYESGVFSFQVVKGHGDLSITSTPSGASVYLEDKSRGTTPLKISGLEEGTYDISVQKSGYKSYVGQVSILPGKIRTLTVTLPKATAEIKTTSSPSGVNVYVDGSYKGRTPMTISDVSPGPHTVKFTYQGYDDYQKEVSVSAGDVISIPATLQKSFPIPLPKIPGLSNEAVLGLIGILLLIGVATPFALKSLNESPRRRKQKKSTSTKSPSKDMDPREDIGPFEYEKIQILSNIDKLNDELDKSRNGEEIRAFQEEMLKEKIKLAQIYVHLQDKPSLLKSLKDIKRNSDENLDEIMDFILQTEYLINNRMPITPEFHVGLLNLLNRMKK